MSEDVRASDGADDLALDHYLRDIDTGKSPVAENTPAGDGEWGVLKVSAVQEGWFQSRENKVIRDAAHIQPRFEVRPGDLLMTRANTEALVGLACIAETPPPRLMLSDKTLRLVVDEGVADPAFVSLALLRPAVRNQVRAMATGTSAGMKNISQRQIRQLRVRVHPWSSSAGSSPCTPPSSGGSASWSTCTRSWQQWRVRLLPASCLPVGRTAWCR